MTNKTVLPKELPRIQIAGEDYVLVPVKVIRDVLPPRRCKLVLRGPSYDDWLDAMDRYFRCVFRRHPRAL